MPGKFVNKAELSAILDKSQRQITTFQARGMPFVQGTGRGNENEYDTAAVIQWMITQEAKGGIDIDEQKAALLKEQTELARRRNMVESGELIELDQVITIAQRFVFSIRQKVVNCALSLETKQAILADLRALGEVDWETIKVPEEEGPKEEPTEKKAKAE